MTRKQRLQALEQSLGIRKHRTALVLLLTCEATPEQQAAIDEAKRTRRPILIIRGTMPADYGAVIEVSEYGGSGSPKPDMTPLAIAGRWD